MLFVIPGHTERTAASLGEIPYIVSVTFIFIILIIMLDLFYSELNACHSDANDAMCKTKETMWSHIRKNKTKLVSYCRGEHFRASNHMLRLEEEILILIL